MFWPEIIYHLEIEEVQCKALKQPRHMLEPRPEKGRWCALQRIGGGRGALEVPSSYTLECVWKYYSAVYRM